MAGSKQPIAVSHSRKYTMRQPSRSVTATLRSVVPSTRMDGTSTTSSAYPVAFVSSNGAGRKGKEGEFEHDDYETNIDVVVRCRGRTEREVRENSGVVLQTDWVRGTNLELSMGLSALSNKTYRFDKVFSSAADQSMIYNDVVAPILDEMLAGYNCTVFAYGQTGTGKTYTMSGDMSDHSGMLPDTAGIIPRPLNALFTKLEIDNVESSVNVSFIELYNEELRNLIAFNDNVKLKIYEDNNKKGHSSTLVQGMEESYIKSAAEGVKILQDGSLKRQVAATKCNDLSSRSHTVFTISAYIKRMADNGEDYISTGKLNLVDLAGIENIQRSGAENKRAAEAGLINKSLLTLGRVINALVEKSSKDIHIPYRESKLTRLLQDSLGGHTKTCIIAAVSPARSNLEETISTLDYTLRAKNIRDKPQLIPTVDKKTLLREFTGEIEKLKSELKAIRQKNGVYLTDELYEEMTIQSESRKILSEEQAAKIETIESNLRNKVQELFSLTSNFTALKKDNDSTKAVLYETKSGFEQAKSLLAESRQSLAEESLLRKAHQHTEEQLEVLGKELILTLSKTLCDIDGLHAKNRRRSDLHMLNRSKWEVSQTQLLETTTLVETRVDSFKAQQQDLVSSLTDDMRYFVYEELSKLSIAQRLLEEKVAAFENSEVEIFSQTKSAKKRMDAVLEEAKTLREDVKSRVGDSLKGLSKAAERISAEVISGIGAFNTQLDDSYSSPNQEFKSLFDDLIKHIDAQQAEANKLREQLNLASNIAMQANVAASVQLENPLRIEREKAAADRQTLLSQITNLILNQGVVQDQRFEEKTSEIRSVISSSRDSFEVAQAQCSQGMDSWNEKEAKLVEKILKSRDALESKLKDDWVAANLHNLSLQRTTGSIHNETVKILDQQMTDISAQLQVLDKSVTRAQSQNTYHCDQHITSLEGLSTCVKSSYTNIGSHLKSTYEQIKVTGDNVLSSYVSSQNHLDTVEDMVRLPLVDLRSNLSSTNLEEYKPTGESPRKVSYFYPTELPRTGDHEKLIATLRCSNVSSDENETPRSASGATICHDIHKESGGETSCLINELTSKGTPVLAGLLRELDANANVGISYSSDGRTSAVNKSATGPLLAFPPHSLNMERSMTASGRFAISKSGKTSTCKLVSEGRENVPPSTFGITKGRRRSYGELRL